MLFGVYEDERFREQICYIFGLFFSVYGIEWEAVSYTDLAGRRVTEADIVISYGRKGTGKAFPHQIHIYASPLFSSDYLKLSSMPRKPLAYYGDLPIIYQGETPVERHMRRENDIAETDIDIIASSFFMLTRYEEVVLPEQDEFGRFPGTASLAFREGFLHRPVVNEYIDLLWDWIKGFDRGLVRRELWEGRDFAVCLTVDVDKVSKYGRWPPQRFSLDLMLLPNDRRCLHRLQQLSRNRPRVNFRSPVPMNEITEVLSQYDVGLFLLWPGAFSYRMALPNKLFEFIQGRLAIAIWPSPEMARVVRESGCGVVAKDFTIESMAEAINGLSAEDIWRLKKHSHRVAPRLSAQNNRQLMVDLVHRLIE